MSERKSHERQKKVLLAALAEERRIGAIDSEEYTRRAKEILDGGSVSQ